MMQELACAVLIGYAGIALVGVTGLAIGTPMLLAGGLVAFLGAPVFAAGAYASYEFVAGAVDGLSDDVNYCF